MGLDGLLAKARGLIAGLEAEVAIVVDVMLPIQRLVEVLDAFRAAFPTVALRLYVEALGAVAQLVLDGVDEPGGERTGVPAERMSGLDEWRVEEIMTAEDELVERRKSGEAERVGLRHEANPTRAAESHGDRPHDGGGRDRTTGTDQPDAERGTARSLRQRSS